MDLFTIHSHFEYNGIKTSSVEKMFFYKKGLNKIATFFYRALSVNTNIYLSY